MPKRSSIKQPDNNQLAARVASFATDEPASRRKKDPAAVSLGRRGGLKGGRARAEALSPARRSKIAKKAAAARWSAKP